MDLKMRSKPVNVIFSILILLLSSLLFASFYFPQIVNNESGIITIYGTRELVENAITLIKNYAQAAPSDISYIQEYIDVYASSFGYLVLLGVTAIVLFVNYIIVIVRTIQGLAGKDINRQLMKHVLIMVTSSVTYVAFLLGIFYFRQYSTPTSYTYVTPGYGLYALLGTAVILFVICSIIKISYQDNKKPASRVLKVIISFLSLVATTIFFMSIFRVVDTTATSDYSYNIKSGFGLILYFFASYLKGGTASNEIMFSALALVSISFIFAAQTTFNKLIVNSFELEIDKEDETIKDVGGGLIARSIIALIFTGIGSFLTVYCLKLLSPAHNFVIGYPLFISMGIAVICFVLSIIHKANSKELKEEVEKETSSTLKLEVKEEPKEKTPAVEIEPAEEVMDEGNINNLDKESPIDKLGINIDDLMKK